jgi:hypothetical protein
MSLFRPYSRRLFFSVIAVFCIVSSTAPAQSKSKFAKETRMYRGKYVAAVAMDRRSARNEKFRRNVI